MTIIVGFVPVAEGWAALKRGIEEARLRDEDVLVLNSSPGDRYSDPSFATAAQLDEVARLFEGSDVRFELTQPVRGRDAADEILGAAEKADASLIVVGVRHRSVVGKLIMGSTSQRVLLDARCAVLAVKV